MTKDTQTGQRPLRVAIIEQNSIRAAILLDGLRDAGVADVEVIDSMTHMLRRLSTIDPDVIIIGIENPSRDGFCRNSFFPNAGLWPVLVREGDARCSKAVISIVQ